MLWAKNKLQVPPKLDSCIRGRTLPSLLDEVCVELSDANNRGITNNPIPHTKTAKNPTLNHQSAFNQWTDNGWRSLSTQVFQEEVESLAIGLLTLGLQKQDHVALLMHSDVNFCIADLGSLLANLVNIPIDLTQTLENIVFVLRHSEANALIISNLDLLAQMLPHFQDLPSLKHIIVAEVPPDWPQVRSRWTTQSTSSSQTAFSASTIPASACLEIPTVLHPVPQDRKYPALPECFKLSSLEEVQAIGKAQPSAALQQQALRATLTPENLATIIYIPDSTGQLQGVMLSHDNLAANALTAFASIPNLHRGAREVVLSFLPLTHVFARTLLYGHINYGHSIYFSNPNRVMKHLKEVKPTLFSTVPLLLEKIYSKGLEKANKSTSLLEKRVFNWALSLAQKFDLEHSAKRGYKHLLQLADEWVLWQWRSLFGGRLKYMMSGGAALNAELVRVFAAAGVTILQGYGLTQTSSVISCNRGHWNRAGTVGLPIAGAEFAIAEDGEILVRGPYVMQGYYKNPEATQADVDPQGWFHTGDLGAFDSDGFLRITGIKKALFKLSTGKYIAPQPIEERLRHSSLVKQAIAVGHDRKFCAALIFPDVAALQAQGLDLPLEALLQHPCILALYQAVIDAANCHLPYWSTIKRFRLVNTELMVEKDQITAAKTLKRAQILADFTADIEALYGEKEGAHSTNIQRSARPDHPSVSCPIVSAPNCPTVAQSLNPRLTT